MLNKKWKKSQQMEKTFYRWSKLSANVLSEDKIEVFAFSIEGQGEIKMSWIMINRIPVAKLEVYADGFWMLSHVKDLIDDLKEWDQYLLGYENQKLMSPNDFEVLLIKHGFKEITYS